MRFLLDPETTAEGVTKETTTAEVVAPVVAKPDPNKLTVDKSTYENERAELDRLRKEESDRQKAVRDAEDEAARKKGDFEKIISGKDSDLAAKDRTIAELRDASTHIERVAGKALAEAKLLAALPSGVLEGKQDQLVKLMIGGLETTRSGDEFIVKAKDGRSVKEYVAAEIAKEYQHFLTATNRGGAGGGGNDATRTPQMGDKPKTEGERMAERFLATEGRSGSSWSRRYQNQN